MVDSINTNAEWLFAGFIRVTGTEIHEKDRTAFRPALRVAGKADGYCVRQSSMTNAATHDRAYTTQLYADLCRRVASVGS